MRVCVCDVCVCVCVCVMCVCVCVCVCACVCVYIHTYVHVCSSSRDTVYAIQCVLSHIQLMTKEELEKIVLPVKSTTFRDIQRDIKKRCVTFYE